MSCLNRSVQRPFFFSSTVFQLSWFLTIFFFFFYLQMIVLFARHISYFCSCQYDWISHLFHSLRRLNPRKSAAIETHRRPRCTVCTPWGERRRCTALESAFGRKRIIEGVPLRESSPRFSFFMILYVYVFSISSVIQLNYALTLILIYLWSF